MTNAQDRSTTARQQLRAKLADLRERLEALDQQLAELSSESEAIGAGDPIDTDSWASRDTEPSRSAQGTPTTDPARRTEMALRDVSDRMASALETLESNARLYETAVATERPEGRPRSLELLREAEQLLEELFERQRFQIELLRETESRRRETARRMDASISFLHILQRQSRDELERLEQQVNYLEMLQLAAQEHLLNQERIVAQLHKSATGDSPGQSPKERLGLPEDERRLKDLSAHYQSIQARRKEAEARWIDQKERCLYLQQRLRVAEARRSWLETDSLRTSRLPNYTHEVAYSDFKRTIEKGRTHRRSSADQSGPPSGERSRTLWDIFSSFAGSTSSAGLGVPWLSALTSLLTGQRADRNTMSGSESAVVALALARFLQDNPDWTNWPAGSSRHSQGGPIESANDVASVEPQTRSNSKTGRSRETRTEAERESRDE